MSGLWTYLNSSELVYKVQSFFGVEKVDQKDENKEKFKINNRFFYYLFLIGTELGDEHFYGLFIPLFFLNVDCHLGRRFVFHWFINMYIGQALKEVFKYERPKSPAVQMQTKWSNEFSLPSTHAMGSLSMSSALIYFAIDRYNLAASMGVIFIVVWVSVISLSRVYFGMHSVLDLVLGVVITMFFLFATLPVTDVIMAFFAMAPIAPIMFFLIPIVLIIFFPTTNMWTPTRGDTCAVAAVFSGIELGVWTNYQLGMLTQVDEVYPLTLDFSDIYCLAGRTLLGLMIVGLTEFIGKQFSYSTLCILINEDKKTLKASVNSVNNIKKNFVDLTSNFFTYSLLGFNTIVIVPITYKYLNIQRESFFNEI